MKSVVELIIDDDCWSTGADEEGINCYVTNEYTHYFDMFRTLEGKEVWVCITIGSELYKTLYNRHWTKLNDPVEVELENHIVILHDKRVYRTDYNFRIEPDYKESLIDKEERWLNVLPAEFFIGKGHLMGLRRRNRFLFGY